MGSEPLSTASRLTAEICGLNPLKEGLGLLDLQFYVYAGGDF